MARPDRTPLHPEAIGVDAIVEHTHALADLADGADLTAPVPTCDGWSIADLLYHLMEVQIFWSTMIDQRPAGPETYTEPPRPADADLADALRTAARELHTKLSPLGFDEAMWSWSPDHTVGFTLRRQTHEALIHLVDGALAAGTMMPAAAPERWADGVDELLRVVLLTGRVDDFTPDGNRLRIETTDTGDGWEVVFGQVTGEDGAPTTTVRSELVDSSGGAAIRGTAAALDCWLWGRPTPESPATDDATLADALRRVITVETQ